MWAVVVLAGVGLLSGLAATSVARDEPGPPPPGLRRHRDGPWGHRAQAAGNAAMHGHAARCPATADLDRCPVWPRQRQGRKRGPRRSSRPPGSNRPENASGRSGGGTTSRFTSAEFMSTRPPNESCGGTWTVTLHDHFRSHARRRHNPPFQLRGAQPGVGRGRRAPGPGPTALSTGYAGAESTPVPAARQRPASKPPWSSGVGTTGVTSSPPGVVDRGLLVGEVGQHR